MNTMGLSTSQKVAALLLPASGVLLYWLYRLNSKSGMPLFQSYYLLSSLYLVFLFKKFGADI